MIDKSKLVDLSHVMYPGKEEYGLELETHEAANLYPQYEVDDGFWYILQTMHMGSHCGTHIEFPYHHNKDGLHAGNYPLEHLIGSCVLLDFKYKKANDETTLDDLLEHESQIKKDDMILLNFGCSVNYGTSKSHDRPFVSHQGIRWLVEEKKSHLSVPMRQVLRLKVLPISLIISF